MGWTCAAGPQAKKTAAYGCLVLYWAQTNAVGSAIIHFRDISRDCRGIATRTWAKSARRKWPASFSRCGGFPVHWVRCMLYLLTSLRSKVRPRQKQATWGIYLRGCWTPLVFGYRAGAVVFHLYPFPPLWNCQLAAGLQSKGLLLAVASTQLAVAPLVCGEIHLKP